MLKALLGAGTILTFLAGGAVAQHGHYPHSGYSKPSYPPSGGRRVPGHSPRPGHGGGGYGHGGGTNYGGVAAGIGAGILLLDQIQRAQPQPPPQQYYEPVPQRPQPQARQPKRKQPQQAKQPKQPKERSIEPAQTDLPAIPPGEIRIARPEDVSTEKALQMLQAQNNPNQVYMVGKDGFVRTYDVRGGALLMSTVAFNDGEFISFTPEGFFDGSERGPEGLLFGTRGLPVRFADLFMALFRPDLVRERGLGDPRGLVQLASGDMSLQRLVDSGPPPKVAIRKPKQQTVSAEEFTAEIDLADLGGGAGQVEWRINGITLGIDRVPQLSPGSQPTRLTRTFLLEPGDNRIEVVAYNGQDLVSSAPVEVTVTRKAPAAQDAPKIHVVAMGVNDYADAKLKLDFAVPDARAISGALKAGQPNIEITPVENGEVTAANLERVFTEVSKKVKPGDTFVFFTAGHGKTLDGRYFFAPQDMIYENDDSLRAKGVTQEKFQALFARIPARKSLLIYDTCESSTLTGDALQTQLVAQNASAQKLAKATGRTVLAAASGAALEGYRGHGVLTYSLLDGLGSGDKDANGTISVSELTNFVATKVPEISEQTFKVKQVPQVRLTGADFPLIKTTATLSVAAEGASAKN